MGQAVRTAGRAAPSSIEEARGGGGVARPGQRGKGGGGGSGTGNPCTRLVAAALELFNRRGYAATTVREIVQAAGVTKPVLYYHFGSKEGIYTAILERSLEEFTTAVAALEAREGTVRERIERLLGEVFDLFLQHQPVVRLVHAVFYGPAEGAPPFDFEKFHRVFHGAIRRLVEEGVARGEFRPGSVEDMAVLLHGVAAICMDLELVELPERPGRQGLERMLALIFRGIERKRSEEEA
ncbi:MAG: TetR/AcrR family transcriptional regulator [Thermoanaerobaculaceae bacterium]|nr:TetR/AcrR family transcriptional regulator [Thermoanaerobaculaceae bacterium]